MNRNTMQIDISRVRTRAWQCARIAALKPWETARRRPAASTGAVWGLITLGRLFLGGAVGMADDGDGHRLMCQLGVAPHPLGPGQDPWAYMSPRYDAYTWYGESCSAGGSGQPYLSTEYFALLFAKLFTRIYGLPGALDLRMLGLVFALSVGVAVGWLVREMPGPAWSRVLIASGVGLAAVDSAIAPYYISPYSEPAELIGILLLIPALLRLLSHERMRVVDLLLVTVIAAWTICSETGASAVLIVIVPTLLLRASLRPIGFRTATRAGSLVSLAATRAPAIATCSCLILATVGFQDHQSRWINEEIRYEQVFGGILGHSPNVPGDLRALQLPADFAEAAGSTIVSPNSATRLPDYPAFVERTTFDGILDFYVTHPIRLVGVADRGFAGLSATRPAYLGNYDAGRGAQAFQKECRVCVATALFTLAEPFRWIVIPGLWLGALFVGFRVARRRLAPARARGVGIVLIAVATTAAARFWTVMLAGDDGDTGKLMAPAVFGTMLLGPLLLGALAAADQIEDSVKVSAEVRFPQQRELREVRTLGHPVPMAALARMCRPHG